MNFIDLEYVPGKDDVIAEYYVEPNRISFEKACNHIAGESSIGTWTSLTTMKERILRDLKPSVYYINKKERIMRIAYPLELFELGNIPQIMSSVGGNVFGMKVIRNLRLLDIHFPAMYIKSFKGPVHGISGVRKITGVRKRPLLGTIVKPKLGLDEKEHAKSAYDSWTGGLDLVKDDENLTNMKFNRFEKRVAETLKMRDKAERETGERKFYMPNITAEANEMIRRAEIVKGYGGEYVMVDIVSVGWSALQTVREFNENMRFVIHAHRAGHAAFTKNLKHGISMLVVAKLARLIGVDQIHIGTADVGKMEGSREEITEIEDEIEESLILEKGHVLEQKWHHIKPVFAVASGGLHPGSIPRLVKRMGCNVIIQAGGGVHGHPKGSLAGAKAMRQALEAVMEGVSLKEYAKRHEELREALNKWK
ncbi:MAG: type III ribulose-bisphosphate carboxylase [Candidatus Aenigmarchaeota archaeon]|nr:type III ribulose-bisphosphate carboxylase [Candidatus Aenigmarchaeota archaeon]